MAGASVTGQYRGQVAFPSMDYEFARFNVLPTVSVLGHGNQTSLNNLTLNSAGTSTAVDIWQLITPTTSVAIAGLQIPPGFVPGLTFFYDISCPAGIIVNAKSGQADFTVSFRENQ